MCMCVCVCMRACGRIYVQRRARVCVHTCARVCDPFYRSFNPSQLVRLRGRLHWTRSFLHFILYFRNSLTSPRFVTTPPLPHTHTHTHMHTHTHTYTVFPLLRLSHFHTLLRPPSLSTRHGSFVKHDCHTHSHILSHIITHTHTHMHTHTHKHTQNTQNTRSHCFFR